MLSVNTRGISLQTFFFSRSTAYLKYNDQTTPYQNSLLDPAFAIGYRTNCVISSRCYRISLNIFKRFVSVMNLLVRVLKNKTIFVDTKLLLCFFSNRLYSWSELLPHTKIKQSWMLNLNINGGCWRRLKGFWASYFWKQEFYHGKAIKLGDKSWRSWMLN